MIIKNLKFKLFLADWVFPLLSVINKNINHNKNTVFFYCNLSFRDNNKALYEYMIANGYNKRYKIIVSSSDYKKYIKTKPENVTFTGSLGSIFWYFKSKYVIYCIGKLPIELGKNQVSIYLHHGMPLKAGAEGQYKQAKEAEKFITYLLSTGRGFVEAVRKIYTVPIEKVIIAGNPKCDALFMPKTNYDFGEYEKLILWVPTFRKSVTMNMDDTSVDDEIIPIIKKEEFNKINEFLKKIGVKIVIKLHPEQELSKYNLMNYDNFMLLSHQDFIRRKMDINRFMTQADAMITDYSSIHFDYMLLDRPIGFTEDDIKEYADKRGFSVDVERFRPGMKLRTFDDICLFAQNVANNIDGYKDIRKSVNDEINEFKDGNFSKNILDIMGIN